MALDQAPDPLGQDTKHRPGGAGKWIVLVVVATVIAVLLVPTRQDGQDSREPLPPKERPSLLAIDRAPPPIDRKDTRSVADGDSPEPAGENAPGAAARRLIRDAQAHPPVDLERIWEQARNFETQGRTDDAYLLYYFAARQGHGPAAMKLGREADPAGFAPGGLFDRPDPVQAHKWYRIAARTGSKEAEAALQVLRVRIEKAAANGDERARGLMLLWK